MRLTVMLTCALLLLSSQLLAHCQIPCGIYDDERRLDTIAEDIVTVEKAIRQVESLSKKAQPDYNQIVRWIDVKEQHADDIADIASWYFLQQRVKPVAETDKEAYESYVHKLTLLHHMMVYSMKVKQSLDMANVEMLKSTLDDFRHAYMGDEGHSH